jgi:hypothetical protein
VIAASTWSSKEPTARSSASSKSRVTRSTGPGPQGRGIIATHRGVLVDEHMDSAPSSDPVEPTFVRCTAVWPPLFGTNASSLGQR